MAVVAGIQAGKGAYQIGGAQPLAPVRLGVSAGVAFTASAASVAIPTDAASNAYAAVRLTVSVAAWVAFTTGSGAATVAGANCYLIAPGTIWDVIPPPGATTVSAINADAATAGSLGVVGLY